MRQALTLAERAERAGEVPVGAILVKDDTVLAEGWNQTVGSFDPTAHAEIVALRAAAASVRNYRLTDTTLYVTLEPCPMCAGALVYARVARVVFAARDPVAGAAGSACDVFAVPSLNHRVQVSGGVLEAESAERLRAFFRARR